MLFALPVLLVFLVFSWGPIVKGLVMSVQQTNLVDPVKWVGLDNFHYVLTDPGVGQAALNTLWFTLLALLFGFPVPVLLAMFLSELRGRSWLYTTLAYLPVITPPVVAILLWRFFYDRRPAACSTRSSAPSDSDRTRGWTARRPRCRRSCWKRPGPARATR